MAVTPFSTRIATSCWRSIRRITTEADVRTEGTDIDLILDPLIVSRPAACIVILDAARKNPWQQVASSRVRGLSGQPPIEGVTVIYPVAPGDVVGDAPRDTNLFAVELVKSAKIQGLSFKEVLRRVRTSVAQATRDRQIPWESSPSPEELVISSIRKPVRAADPLERGFWETIKGGDNAADFKAYLEFLPGWAICCGGTGAAAADRSQERNQARSCQAGGSRTGGCRASIRHPRLFAMS